MEKKKNPFPCRELNIPVIGGSGSGMTRFYLKKNICFFNTNYIITDPKGELLRLLNMNKSFHGWQITLFQAERGNYIK